MIRSTQALSTSDAAKELKQEDDPVARFLQRLSVDATGLLSAFNAMGCDSEDNLFALCKLPSETRTAWIAKMCTAAASPVSPLTIEVVKNGLFQLAATLDRSP
jgi:hypothetical protein